MALKLVPDLPLLSVTATLTTKFWIWINVSKIKGFIRIENQRLQSIAVPVINFARPCLPWIGIGERTHMQECISLVDCGVGERRDNRCHITGKPNRFPAADERV